MSDLLEQGAAWLTEQRHKHLTRTVSYARDDTVIIAPLAATIGRTLFEQADDYGVVHKIESRDYLIRVVDLAPGGQQTLPQAGDRIKETVGAQVFIYEVMAPGSEPPFRYSDPYRLTLRIHTKHVATEEA